MPVIEFCEECRFSGYEFCEESLFLKLNFVKCPFSDIEFCEKVRFSNTEFCEMCENSLNFLLRRTSVFVVVVVVVVDFIFFLSILYIHCQIEPPSFEIG